MKRARGTQSGPKVLLLLPQWAQWPSKEAETDTSESFTPAATCEPGNDNADTCTGAKHRESHHHLTP